MKNFPLLISHNTPPLSVGSVVLCHCSVFFSCVLVGSIPYADPKSNRYFFLLWNSPLFILQHYIVHNSQAHTCTGTDRRSTEKFIGCVYCNTSATTEHAKVKCSLFHFSRNGVSDCSCVCVFFLSLHAKVQFFIMTKCIIYQLM